jgi:predicted  nucleic acid-binding Zn-ribbon protein
MDDVEQFKEDVRGGRIDAERLIDLVVMLQRRLQEAQRRIDELEKKLGAATVTIEEPFSLRAEEQRQEARGKQRPKRQPPSGAAGCGRRRRWHLPSERNKSFRRA